MSGEALPAEHNVVVASSGSFASVKDAESSFPPLLLLSISKLLALKLARKTEGADMQLSRLFATAEAE